MRAHDDRREAPSTPRIPASRADACAPRASVRWDGVVDAAVPAAAPDPAEIRALAFVASIGPVRGPHTTEAADDVVIDLAGEEALLEYLGRLSPVSVD